eukprot:4083741-Prymnesium_polylepis.1
MSRCSPSVHALFTHAPSTRSEQTRATCPIHTHLPRARSMTTSLCVLALHGRVAKDGNYSESVVVSVVVVVAGGLAWVRRQAFETDNIPRLKT